MVGVLVGEIAVRRRQARWNIILARDEVVGLYVVAEMLAVGRNTQAIVGSVAEIRDLLFLTDCRFDSTVTESNDPLVDRSGELQYGQQPDWSLAIDALPNREVVLAVESQGRRFGRYILRGPAIGAPLGQNRRLAAVALSDLAGAALNAEADGYQDTYHWIP